MERQWEEEIKKISETKRKDNVGRKGRGKKVEEGKKIYSSLRMGKTRQELRSDTEIPARFDILKFLNMFRFCFKLYNNRH
jgi:hypothetical protein